MIRIEVAPEGQQLRFLVLDGKRLICAFAKENEAQAYLLMKQRAIKRQSVSA